MSESQTSNPSIQLSDVVLDHSLSSEMTPVTTSTQPCTETTSIVELADEQLEIVVGAGWGYRPQVE